MNKVPAMFFLGKELVGQILIDDEIFSRFMELVPAESYIFFCPKCGEVWGRIHLVKEGVEWRACERECERCDPEFGGSFYVVWWNTDLTKDWYPDGVRHHNPYDVYRPAIVEASIKEPTVSLDDLL